MFGCSFICLLSGFRLGRLAALLTLLSIVACATPPPIDPTLASNGTVFRTYDLGQLGFRPDDSNEMRTFIAMIRDVVGQEGWMQSNSSVHHLDHVLLIRTSLSGHESLGLFFSQFRVINDQAALAAR